jgi:predicted DNA-binding protein
MYKTQKEILMGVRIPQVLKERLSGYCAGHGIKMNYFVAQAIQERLIEVMEENADVSEAKERLKDAEFISQKEFGKYLTKRKVKR